MLVDLYLEPDLPVGANFISSHVHGSFASPLHVPYLADCVLITWAIMGRVEFIKLYSYFPWWQGNWLILADDLP